MNRCLMKLCTKMVLWQPLEPYWLARPWMKVTRFVFLACTIPLKPSHGLNSRNIIRYSQCQFITAREATATTRGRYV